MKWFYSFKEKRKAIDSKLWVLVGLRIELTEHSLIPMMCQVWNPSRTLTFPEDITVEWGVCVPVVYVLGCGCLCACGACVCVYEVYTCVCMSVSMWCVCTRVYSLTCLCVCESVSLCDCVKISFYSLTWSQLKFDIIVIFATCSQS